MAVAAVTQALIAAVAMAAMVEQILAVVAVLEDTLVDAAVTAVTIPPLGKLALVVQAAVPQAVTIKVTTEHTAVVA